MNPILVEELVEILKVSDAEAASPERRKAWDTGNELSVQLQQLRSVLILLADAHRLQHEHKEQVAEHIWGHTFAFLGAVAERASDQVDEILRGAFPITPDALKTAEKT